MIHYTGHINWNWVLDEALQSIQYDGVRKERRKTLPSAAIFDGPNSYALFRIERKIAESNHIYSAWATSRCLEFLDPKDALYRELLQCGMQNSMPRTQLLDWDSTQEGVAVSLPTIPALLKAPLGSGGDSLYYVNDKNDVLAVIKEHATKAASVPGFIDSLIEQYGKVPQWSLQEIYPSIKIARNSRNCQIRAYLVFCGGNLYLYTSYEVRQPFWESSCCDTTSAEIAPMLKADISFVQTSNAVPYNFGRSKVGTERMLLDEVEELSGESVQSTITNLMTTTFAAIQSSIQAHFSPDIYCEQNDSECLLTMSELAIAGVDLMMDANLNAKIVELNNNPAMPSPQKHMSPKYKQHLIEFVSNIIQLGLAPERSDDILNTLKFQKVW